MRRVTVMFDGRPLEVGLQESEYAVYAEREAAEALRVAEWQRERDRLNAAPRRVTRRQGWLQRLAAWAVTWIACAVGIVLLPFLPDGEEGRTM